jgi:hypothetical protein
MDGSPASAGRLNDEWLRSRDQASMNRVYALDDLSPLFDHH